ncbi:glycoside hydrolase family 13 protein [Xylariaceae sp. FL0804]|nr:glycoside hydrolase family 13 protein [Xylariaceae sp. FL0804]
MRSTAATALKLAAALGQAAGVVRALSTADWEGQSIYQVMTDRFARTDLSTDACDDLNDYCGGTWAGLTSKLDYIQNMGFTAIWISPIVYNLEGDTSDGSAYHGYWAQDLYSLNANFGTAADLSNLSAELHDRGMYLMVDVVTNHFGYDGCGTCVDYSVFNPFNSEADFHPFCLIDYDNDTSVQVCWEGDNTVSLPDIVTTDSGIRDTFGSWIADLVDEYDIDGLRIDSCLEVEKDFFPDFVSSAGVYAVCEVDNGDPSIYPDWLNYVPGTLNYAVYYWVTRAFESTDATMSELVSGIDEMKAQQATATLGGFLENHDNARFPSLTSDLALARNAIAFVLLMDGVPIIYQGQEQHFSGAAVPSNREALWTTGWDTTADLYTWIAGVNQIRNQAVYVDGTNYLGYQAVPESPADDTIAMRKYSMVSVFTNIGASGSSYSVTLDGSFTGWDANTALTEALACTSATADSNGGLTFTMGTNTQVYYPTSKLTGSGICGREWS